MYADRSSGDVRSTSLQAQQPRRQVELSTAGLRGLGLIICRRSRFAPAQRWLLPLLVGLGFRTTHCQGAANCRCWSWVTALDGAAAPTVSTLQRTFVAMNILLGLLSFLGCVIQGHNGQILLAQVLELIQHGTVRLVLLCSSAPRINPDSLAEDLGLAPSQTVPRARFHLASQQANSTAKRSS